MVQNAKLLSIRTSKASLNQLATLQSQKHLLYQLGNP